MDFSVFLRESTFDPYTDEHYYPLIIIGLIGLITILTAKYLLGSKGQKQLLFCLSLIPAMGCSFLIILRLVTGVFEIEDDLPLHICRILSLTAPIVIWRWNRYWLGIFYFWILAGTLNANITPDIDFGFPHYEHITYWLMHSFLVILPIYYVIVMKVRINWTDLKNAFWMANVFMLSTLGINLLIGSNYMYTVNKPPVASILDYFGPWPIYLITGQLLALLLFLLLMIPFALKAKKS